MGPAPSHRAPPALSPPMTAPACAPQRAAHLLRRRRASNVPSKPRHRIAHTLRTRAQRAVPRHGVSRDGGGWCLRRPRSRRPGSWHGQARVHEARAACRGRAPRAWAEADTGRRRPVAVFLACCILKPKHPVPSQIRHPRDLSPYLPRAKPLDPGLTRPEICCNDDQARSLSGGLK
jgi:hypothetical protein